MQSRYIDNFCSDKSATADCFYVVTVYKAHLRSRWLRRQLSLLPSSSAFPCSRRANLQLQLDKIQAFEGFWDEFNNVTDVTRTGDNGGHFLNKVLTYFESTIESEYGIRWKSDTLAKRHGYSLCDAHGSAVKKHVNTYAVNGTQPETAHDFACVMNNMAFDYDAKELAFSYNARTRAYPIEAINRAEKQAAFDSVRDVSGIQKMCCFLYNVKDDQGDDVHVPGVVRMKEVSGEGGQFSVRDMVVRGKAYGRVCHNCTLVKQRPMYHAKDILSGESTVCMFSHSKGAHRTHFSHLAGYQEKVKKEPKSNSTSQLGDQQPKRMSKQMKLKKEPKSDSTSQLGEMSEPKQPKAKPKKKVIVPLNQIAMFTSDWDHKADRGRERGQGIDGDDDQAPFCENVSCTDADDSNQSERVQKGKNDLGRQQGSDNDDDYLDDASEDDDFEGDQVDEVDEGDDSFDNSSSSTGPKQHRLDKVVGVVYEMNEITKQYEARYKLRWVGSKAADDTYQPAEDVPADMLAEFCKSRQFETLDNWRARTAASAKRLESKGQGRGRRSDRSKVEPVQTDYELLRLKQIDDNNAKIAWLFPPSDSSPPQQKKKRKRRDTSEQGAVRKSSRVSSQMETDS